MDKELLRKHSKGLIALSACLQGELRRPTRRGCRRGVKVALEHERSWQRQLLPVAHGYGSRAEKQRTCTARIGATKIPDGRDERPFITCDAEDAEART